MGADPDPVFFAEAHGPVHYGGVRGVEAAGDIGGGEVGNDPGIAADGIGAVGFSHVAVQIDEWFHGVSINLKKAPSSSTEMPRAFALASLAPGDVPATT